jgi:FKBP-type peptidyl-prolyl cis-trans isomerase
MNRYLVRCFPIIFSLLIYSCSSKGTWEKEELQQISDYLKTLPAGLAILKPSGLYYIEEIYGNGPSPVSNDIVYFKYKGTFLNGVSFDSLSIVNNIPYEYLMGSGTIVAGVDEGLRYMNVGGRSRLLTPSKLAYGAAGIWGSVPGYTPLLWEIELDSIKKMPGKK